MASLVGTSSTTIARPTWEEIEDLKKGLTLVTAGDLAAYSTQDEIDRLWAYRRAVKAGFFNDGPQNLQYSF